MLRSSRKLSSFHPFRSLQIDRPISPLIFLLLLFLLDSPSLGERIVLLDGHFRKFVRNCFTLLFISFYLHRCFYAFHEVSKRQFSFPFQCSSIVKNPINVVTESPLPSLSFYPIVFTTVLPERRYRLFKQSRFLSLFLFGGMEASFNLTVIILYSFLSYVLRFLFYFSRLFELYEVVYIYTLLSRILLATGYEGR